MPEPGLVHDCARVERDTMDLYAALAEAVRRLCAARGSVTSAWLRDVLRTDDLTEVLDRTSRPIETPAARLAARERTAAHGGFAS